MYPPAKENQVRHKMSQKIEKLKSLGRIKHTMRNFYFHVRRPRKPKKAQKDSKRPTNEAILVQFHFNLKSISTQYSCDVKAFTQYYFQYTIMYSTNPAREYYLYKTLVCCREKSFSKQNMFIFVTKSTLRFCTLCVTRVRLHLVN